jgi:hypothetical protein
MKNTMCLGWIVVLSLLGTACPPTSTGTTPQDGGDMGAGNPDSSAVTDGPTGGLAFQPSNVTVASVMAQIASAQDEEIMGGCSSIGISTRPPIGSCTQSPITMTTEQTTAGPQPVALIVVKSLKIDANVAVLVEGDIPLVIVSLGDVTLESGASIQANSISHLSYTGPGGAPSPTNGDEKGNGPGAGAAGDTTGDTSIGAGGGAFCGVGGPGGAASAAAKPYGSSDLRPLLGGSSGGTANGGGGAGGGAIQISAMGAISVIGDAYITTGGQGGASCINGACSAGGSGGAILLEGTTVNVAGILAANGGAGGSGSGGGSDALPLMTSQLPSEAPGGPATDSSAAGGNGSAGSVTAGSPGLAGTESTTKPGGSISGGGGGGAGWIRVNTPSGMATLTGILSPNTTTSCASQGTVRSMSAGP